MLLASIAALVVTAFDAHAAPLARASAATGEQLAAADGAEFGSRKRYRARRGNAAGLAMMGMVAGTIGAVIAADQQRRAYRRAQYYYDPYGYDPYVYRQPYAYAARRAPTTSRASIISRVLTGNLTAAWRARTTAGSASTPRTRTRQTPPVCPGSAFSRSLVRPLKGDMILSHAPAAAQSSPSVYQSRQIFRRPLTRGPCLSVRMVP